jgi:hypothetical protein
MFSESIPVQVTTAPGDRAGNGEWVEARCPGHHSVTVDYVEKRVYAASALLVGASHGSFFGGTPPKIVLALRPS